MDGVWILFAQREDVNGRIADHETSQEHSEGCMGRQGFMVSRP